MRFWDASAVVPLLVGEPATGLVRRVLAEDSDLVVWWATKVEAASALARMEREGALEKEDARVAQRLLEEIWSGIVEVQPGERVRSTALRLLRTHRLRAADALQLAAALTWRDGEAEEVGFVCLDDRLTEAAQREGFEVGP